MTWFEILDNQLYIGGNVEVIDGNTRFRGPILRMELSDADKRFAFVLEWCAQKSINDSPTNHMWDACPDAARLRVEFECYIIGLPRIQDNGKLHFRIPKSTLHAKDVTVLPRGYWSRIESILDPALVRGLQIPQPV